MFEVFVINSFVVAICVMLHYEFLHRVTAQIPKMSINHRTRIVLAVFSSLIAHAIEIWIFAIAYYYMHQTEGWGQLSGNFNGTLMDCAYFSFTVFSTLGFGDIVPSGDLRYLTGIESLTGLVLITWTASFLFLEMQRYWGDGSNTHSINNSNDSNK
ncbi:potassium channel family protein [Rheinheimera salexigens]|uniref:Ion transporter n=1 Tax=Rheinheimera salexigens TaxID=1628148 RepID=A0A1E7Q343_9GAMM|nr:potassium channel family protein [Rheinheimera salexigens]OEY68549.1 ion transporter [Rheinheimera salexigens]